MSAIVAIPQQSAMLVVRRSSQELAIGARRSSQDLLMGARRTSQEFTKLMIKGRNGANPVQLYRGFARAHPKLANATVGASCAFVGDAIAQKMQAGEETVEFDWKRSAIFTAFNFMWMGGPMSAYCAFLERSGMSVMAKLSATHCIWNPLIYLPSYYLGAGFMRGESLVESSSKLVDEAPPTLVKCTTFWMPVSAVQYSMVPPAMQIAYLSAMSIVWSVILASSG